MAENVPITARRADEAAVFPSASLAVAAFAALVSALDALIRCERDLSGYSGADPAVDPWLRDAERALATVHDWIRVLGDAPRRATGDGQLQLVGRLIGRVMECDDPCAMPPLMRLAGAQRHLFHLPVTDPAAAPAAGAINGLIDAALDRLTICVALAEGPDEAFDAAVTVDHGDDPAPTF